ncbi:MAG: phytanoyl-CoA dioxygenase family protein [Proteobacteria bacterium]|nr:phytanoyl-CoA dioxygenase family protein [Pseudomonadota bacterium]
MIASANSFYPGFNEANVRAWREEGFTLIPTFFGSEVIDPILADFATLYSDRGQGEHVGRELNLKKPGTLGNSHPRQFINFDSLPYRASPAINMISLHPRLINYARALLGTDRVHLYQSHTWAKYTGEADYDQAFHCDFGNHTLTVPADNALDRTVDFVLYLTDVTNDLGALHYVTKPDSDAILGAGELVAPDASQMALKAVERSAAAPAGSLLAHGIDTFHRGTNLTRPNGYRFTMTMGYKACGNDMIGFHVWQHSPDRPWHLIFNQATPDQLSVLGVPLPGEEFWSARTLRLTQARWPQWDMSAYFAAL